VRPELVPVEPGHFVACHLSEIEREQIWEHEIAPKL
jgi:peptide/nickel transport system ATP-binding protein